MSMWQTNQFHYPSGTVTVTRKQFESETCVCGGPKGRNTGRCWKCAGSPQPVPGRTNAARSLNALWRNHPRYRTDHVNRVPDDELLRMASTMTDAELLHMRNFGSACLAWTRERAPFAPKGREPEEAASPRREEWVVERDLGGYRLPDHAIDLSAWLRDGLEVYNLFVLMKPMFFAMLKAHGGEFTASYEDINDDHGARLSFEESKLTFDADNKPHQTITARLGEPTGKTQRFRDDKSLLDTEGREA